MNEVDHFGLWASSLALHTGYRVAYAMHNGFAVRLGRGDVDAIRWAADGQRYLWAEADRYDQPQ